MGLSRRERTRGLCAALLAIGMGPPVFGAAWTQEPGHGQVIFNFSGFRTSRGYDAQGNRVPYTDGGSFRKLEFNPYFEYGATRRNTLVFNTYVPLLRYENDYGRQQSAGLGDVEFGLRRRISGESRTVVSAQLSMKVPAYSAERSPPPGNHQVDVEPRFLIGRGGDLYGHHSFWNLEAGYRVRAGAPADQIRTDAAAGVELTRKVAVMAQFFGITGMRNGQPFAAGTNPNVQSDFDLYKGQVSVVATLRGKTQAQLGWCTTLWGRNTGSGQMFLIALWRRF